MFHGLILELAKVNFPHNGCPMHHLHVLFFISDFKFLELELYLDHIRYSFLIAKKLVKVGQHLLTLTLPKPKPSGSPMGAHPYREAH
jgi:hypothetical protein